MSLLKLGFVKIGGAISTAATAMFGVVKSFLVALLANPIGLIIAAIVAVMAARAKRAKAPLMAVAVAVAATIVVPRQTLLPEGRTLASSIRKSTSPSRRRAL